MNRRLFAIPLAAIGVGGIYFGLTSAHLFLAYLGAVAIVLAVILAIPVASNRPIRFVSESCRSNWHRGCPSPERCACECHWKEIRP